MCYFCASAAGKVDGLLFLYLFSFFFFCSHNHRDRVRFVSLCIFDAYELVTQLHLNEIKCRSRYLILNATQIALVVYILKFMIIVISDN